MHHYDVRTGIHLRMRPLLEPIIRSEPLLHPFREYRCERAIPEHVVVLVHDHEVGVLAGFADALKDALRILLIWRVSGSARQINRRFVFPIAGFNAKLVHARPDRCRASSRRDQA
jgi:hypothetical protein